MQTAEKLYDQSDFSDCVYVAGDHYSNAACTQTKSKYCLVFRSDI
jgi:hypothetical protein